MRSIFIGAPGAGKGTQAQIISQDKGIPHISTGDMFRAAIKNETVVGLKAKSYLDDGKLVPDEIVVEMVEDRISASDCTKGFILDGFPRTLAQAEFLDQVLTRREMPLTLVLHFKVEERELMSRLLARAQKEGRTDDNVDTIPTRFKAFREQTEPLLEFYKKKGLLHTVDAVGTVEEITGRIQKIWKAKHSV